MDYTLGFSSIKVTLPVPKAKNKSGESLLFSFLIVDGLVKSINPEKPRS